MEWIRKSIARLLARWALKLWSECPEAKKFYKQLLVDQLIYGNCVVRVNPCDLPKPPQSKEW